jgi:hypothetical protein
MRPASSLFRASSHVPVEKSELFSPVSPPWGRPKAFCLSYQVPVKNSEMFSPVSPPCVRRPKASCSSSHLPVKNSEMFSPVSPATCQPAYSLPFKLPPARKKEYLNVWSCKTAMGPAKKPSAQAPTGREE